MSTLTNLIAYWRMDESSGNPRRDSVGSCDLAEDFGEVGAASAKLGSAAAVKDGTGSLASAASPGDLSNTELTLAGWLKIGTLPTSGTSNEICYLELEDGAGQYRQLTLYFDATDDNLWIRTQNSNTENTSDVKASTHGAISAGTWYHVVVTWNGTTASIYIDDTEDSGSAQSFTGCLTINQVVFGRNATGSDAYTYDDWGLWDEEISSTDRSDLYNSGTGAIPPGLGYPGGATNSAFMGFHGC